MRIVVVILMLVSLIACASPDPTATPTLASTATPTAIPTVPATPTPTPTPTPMATPSPTPIPTATPQPTSTPPCSTFADAKSAWDGGNPTCVGYPYPTPTPTPRPTATPTPRPTSTPTPTPTPRPTPTPTQVPISGYVMEIGPGLYGFQIAEGAMALAELTFPDTASFIGGIQVPAAGGEWGGYLSAIGSESGIWTGSLTDLVTGYCYVVLSHGFGGDTVPCPSTAHTAKGTTVLRR